MGNFYLKPLLIYLFSKQKFTNIFDLTEEA